jgi:hypothetical protein
MRQLGESLQIGQGAGAPSAIERSDVRHTGVGQKGEAVNAGRQIIK